MLDQKSEPCLLRPKKLALDRQQVKLFADKNCKTYTGQREIESHAMADGSKTPNVGKLQSSNSVCSKRKLTFIKTKNINFHTLSKLSSNRMQPSSTSTH